MKNSNISVTRRRCVILLQSLFLLVILPVQTVDASEFITLDWAIKQAQYNDPWLVENQFVQEALESKSMAAGILPNPTASLSLLNMPTDGFDFNQENMTQLKIGISQMFPRGDTLQLQTKKLQFLSRQNPHLRADRKALVSVLVAGLWLDAFNAKKSIRLIEENRNLFEQLLDISAASYSTAFGGTQQQDVIRAQLELTRLDDRLTKLKQQQEVALKQLNRWISGQFVEHYAVSSLPEMNSLAMDIDSQRLPQLVLRYPELMQLEDTVISTTLASHFVQHPLVVALESRIKASDTDIELNEQKYKSQWGLNASYSYRGDSSNGRHRADLLSLGINFDLPLFTKVKQDKLVQAAVFEAEAIKTQKWLLLRKMIAEFEAAKVQFHRLDQRYQLYQHQLLPQIHEQAEAALTAYTNDEGDFAEVVRARIDVLDAEIDKLGIEVDRQKMIAQINYYLVKGDSSLISEQRGD
ncbi:MAG: transporter [Methylophaga sp.]|nr:MAG: transporter [Methylophaga sp.]